MAQTAHAQTNPFEQIHLLNDDRSQFFLRTAETLAEQLEEVLSRWLSDLSVTAGQPIELLLPEMATDDSDIAVVTTEYHLSTGLVVSDLPLALAVIATMCGGNPNASPDVRPLTRLEIGVYKLVLAPVVETAAKLFMVGPASVGLHVVGASGLGDSKVEPGICIPLEIRMGEVSGLISIGFTAGHLQAYVQELDRVHAGRMATKRDEQNQLLAASVRYVPLELVVGFESVRVPARVLADLQEGDVLRLGQLISQSLVARVGNERLFSVRAAQRGQRLVAEVTGRIASKEGVQ